MHYDILKIKILLVKVAISVIHAVLKHGLTF